MEKELNEEELKSASGGEVSVWYHWYFEYYDKTKQMFTSKHGYNYETEEAAKTAMDTVADELKAQGHTVFESSKKVDSGNKVGGCPFVVY